MDYKDNLFDFQKLSKAKKVFCITALITTLIIICAVCVDYGKNIPIYTETKFLTDTAVSITAYGPEAEAAAQAGFEEFERLAAIFDQYTIDGQVNQVNRYFASEPLQASQGMKIAPELLAIMEFAASYGEKTNGCFDITVGPLTQLWQSKEQEGCVPSEDEIRQTLSRVGYKGIELNTSEGMVRLNPGMALDLGGVSKGYIVDLAMQTMQEYEITGAVIDAGGNVLTWRDNPQGMWTVGVVDPQNPSQLLGYMKFTGSKTVVSSGNYQRGFQIDGRDYGHILNPLSGWPAQDLQSVTILGKYSWEADILSTAAFVMGKEEGIELIENSGYEGLIIDKEGNSAVTTGLKRFFIQVNPR